MSVFLLKNGTVENVVEVPSMEWALYSYPGFQVVLRSPENSHLNIGDAA